MTDLDEVIAAAAARGRQNRPGHGNQPLDQARLSWEPVNLAPILAGERVTPPPVVLMRDDGVNLVYTGRLHLFMGEPESLKTWLALFAISQEIAAGRHVVYIDYEDVVESAVERLLALGAKPDDILTYLSYYDSPPRLDELSQELLRAKFAERGPPSFVVFDGVTEAMDSLGLNPDKGVDIVQFYSGAPRWFARAGAGVALLDHVTKNAEGRGRWAIGSERKLSGLDGAAYALNVLQSFGRGRTGKAKLTVSKDRCGYVRKHVDKKHTIGVFELQSWPDGTVSAHLTPPEASDDDKPFRPTILMERVSKTLEVAPAPLSGRTVRTQTTGNDADLGVALELLVAESFAAKAPAGGRGGGEVYSSLKPFRASEDAAR